MSDLAARRRFGLSKKSLRIILAVLVILFIVTYLFRGVLRVTIIPEYVDNMHRQRLQDTYDGVNKELGYPLTALELNDTYIRNSPAQCGTNTAQNFYVEVGCTAFAGGQSKIIDDAYKQKHSETLGRLDDKLVQSGWNKSHSSGTPTTFKNLLTTEGEGYTGYYGYVRYDKKINGYSCWIDIGRSERLGGVLSCSFTSNIGLNL